MTHRDQCVTILSQSAVNTHFSVTRLITFSLTDAELATVHRPRNINALPLFTFTRILRHVK